MITSRDIPEIPLWRDEANGNSDSNFYSLLAVFAGQRASNLANAYKIQTGVITGAASGTVTVVGEPVIYLVFYSDVIETITTFGYFFKLVVLGSWGAQLQYLFPDGAPADEIRAVISGSGGGGLPGGTPPTVVDNGDGTWDLIINIDASDSNNNLYYLIFYR